jgi:hypothetical protein
MLSAEYPALNEYLASEVPQRAKTDLELQRVAAGVGADRRRESCAPEQAIQRQGVVAEECYDCAEFFDGCGAR